MNSLNTALATIRRSPYQAFTAIIMMAITSFVGYSFTLFLLGSNIIISHFETQPQIIAFFSTEIDHSEVEDVAKEMREKTYVTQVKVVSQEDALKLYQEENKDDPLLLELVTADILPASVEVSGIDIGSLEIIKTDLDKFENIEDVIYQEDVIAVLSDWLNSLRIAGIGITVILAVISFLIIMVVIAMKANAQKNKINVMKILGATKGYILLPFVYEGVIYGLVGTLMGWLVTFAALLYLTPVITVILGDIKLFPIPMEFYAIHAGTGVLVGIILGAFASIVAVRRLVKR
jgi:cell division transport system permease protein